MGMQKGLWDVWFLLCSSLGGRTFFSCFRGLGCFDGGFFGVGCFVCLFVFFPTKFPCLSSIWEFTEWGFLLCCQKASAPGASALSCFHWVICPYSVNGCQNRGRGGQSGVLMQHCFVRAVLLGGTGLFSSYSFKGRAWEIARLESTLTNSRF